MTPLPLPAAPLPALRRRHLLGAGIAATIGAKSAIAASGNEATLSVVSRSPVMCNGVALSSDETVFLGAPRFPGSENTFSVGKVLANGDIQPFPGSGWNDWAPGKDGTTAFVMVNAVHVFFDGTLWVVDQGAPPGSTPKPGAQKLVQIDPKSGKILRILRFSSTIVPPGAQFNDLRIYGDLIFVTDSGLGGVIIHNLKTGRTLRRLSHQPVMRLGKNRFQRGTGGRILQNADGKRPEVESDQIEVDATGTWFYFSVPAGPLKRIKVASLLDTRKTDQQLADEVTVYTDTPTLGGTCMDTLGNVYLSDVENNRITVHSPDGKEAILVQSPRLISPDALFIDKRRRLYIPCPQIQMLPMFNNGKDGVTKPYLVLSTPLPHSLGEFPLGDAVTGAPG